MPYRNLARSAFDPEQIEIIARAYERALNFVLQSRYDDGDPNVKENLAVHIIEAARELPEVSLVDVANRAIARYRVHRDTMRAIAAKQPTYRTRAAFRSASPTARRPGLRLEQNAGAGIFRRQRIFEPHIRV
jgi:hypothetical protein